MSAGQHSPYRDSGITLLEVVGAEVAVVLKRDGQRIAFCASVLVPFAPHRGGVLRPWGVKSAFRYTADELVSAVAAESGGIAHFREVSARQRKTLAPLLDASGPPDAYGHRTRARYRTRRPVRGLALLGRVGSLVDALILVNGVHQRWRGTIVRAPRTPIDTVEIRPFGVDVDGVTLEFLIAQVEDVRPFEASAATAESIARTQRARLGAGGQS